MEKKPERLQFLHSATWSAKGKGECIIATIKDLDTGKNELKYFHNPNRRVFVTKPGLQTEQNNKELCVPLSSVDTYTVPNYRLREELDDILYQGRGGYRRISDLINDPRVFGADIPMDVLIKQHYYNRYGDISNTYRVAGFDIETNVVEEKLYASSAPGGEIIIINYVTPELKIYSAVLTDFLQGHSEEEVYRKIKESLAIFRDNLNEGAQKIYDSFTPEIHLKTFGGELDLLKWIFARIHEDKPDYVSIWNLDFDVPKIIERIEALGGDPRDFFCHPDIPRKYRVFKYRPDNNPNLQHPSHAWHVLECSSPTWWIDGMCLYSRLRKHKGVEDSYGLEAITSKFLGTGKLAFEEGGHVEMQTQRPVEYCAYGAIDSVLLVLLERKNNDVTQMHTLLAHSDIPSFAQQTTQLRNRFFDYCKHRNLVPASQMGKVMQETDEEIINVGGNVLEPGLAWRTGINKIVELGKKIKNKIKGLASKLQYMVLDIDVTSMYPSLARALNICKDTKVLTLLKIEGHSKSDIVDFCGHIQAAKENAVYLGNKYLNLPDYQEMGRLFDQSKEAA